MTNDTGGIVHGFYVNSLRGAAWRVQGSVKAGNACMRCVRRSRKTVHRALPAPGAFGL